MGPAGIQAAGRAGARRGPPASRARAAGWRRRPQSRREGLAGGLPGQVNPVTGKPSPGSGYAARTVNHSETVLRTFYDFHREAGSGPMVNPFPLDRAAAADGRTLITTRWTRGRVNARALPQRSGAAAAAGDPG